MDEVYFGQKLVGLQYFLIMRPDLSREFLQYAYDFTPFFSFQFTDTVVCLHHFSRFDEDRTSCGGFIVDDSFYFTL